MKQGKVVGSILAITCIAVILLGLGLHFDLYPAEWLCWKARLCARPATDIQVLESPIAYCDKVVVCQGGYCGGSSRCNPNLWVWGHSSSGGDVAFRILLRDEDGNVLGDSYRTTVQDYRWVGGLVSQRCDGVLTTSKKNKGQPWNACDFLIPTYGAGGYSLAQYLNYQTRTGSLHVYPEVTYTVQVLASPVEYETTPDGKFLHRWSLGEWNWDAVCEVPLHIFYSNRQYRCDEVSSGEIPHYDAPEITDVTHQVTDTNNSQGYASAVISFATSIEAQGQAYYQVYGVSEPCDPLSGWQSPESEAGIEHAVSLRPDTLWYNVSAPKTYCYQIVAWPVDYKYVSVAKSVSEVYTFTVP